ncbi:uncharacterized protein LOC108916936 [Anoplophora glabripennis]|uniref:uncharacterized protein LOC108916936 n=1 Tax=Anoplophora glabripennis TaxID=217634 RepID=UPI0008757A10|nr:uncharacterized protein LOC108916936 [Anoplophora glabripennis]
MFVYFLFYVLIACTSRTAGITTIHHDKPSESTIPNMATTMNENPEEILNITLSPSERQKRLLPYENYYQTQPMAQPQLEPLYEHSGPSQRFQFDRPPPKKVYLQYDDLSYNQNPPDHNDLYQSSKFTPFLESNAIPGPFRPIIPNHPPQKFKVQYVAVQRPQQSKVIDYSTIYDKLSQLKLQNSRRPAYTQSRRPMEPPRYFSKPQISYVPEGDVYKTIQPTKTIIETFTATNIDIPSAEGMQYNAQDVPQRLQVTPANSYENEEMFYKSFQQNAKPYVNQHIAVEIPQSSYPHQNYEPIVIQKVYQGPKQVIRKPYIVLPRPSGHQEAILRKPIVIIQRKPVYRVKPTFQYVTETPEYEPITPNYIPQYTTPKYEEYQTIVPVTAPPVQTYTENPNALGQILKHLQETNTLPQTLTPDNIDNSIKTLVRILEALKKQHKFSKPIVVADDSSEDYNGSTENEPGGVKGGHISEIPGTVTQSFPADTPDGGTPGKPGVDYPALSSIPQTSFNCKTQRYKGFFGDPDTNCQVWHYCDLNGGQASFLCPNGTIFSQVALTCDWWYNVKCSSTAQLYVLNERLYKYIIPLSPKFPEDYSGPLVDKYLALKFQEMEEKMRKEKKGKGNADKEKENEELQSIETEDTSKTPIIEQSTLNTQRETLETIEDDNDKK